MGPITLFDKSFIQGLSLNESVWFDHFYQGVICPIFFAETLADLRKEVAGDRASLTEIRRVAERTPEMHSAVCANHSYMAAENLLGTVLPMTGQVPLPNPRPVKYGHKRGVAFDEPPEAKALTRWQNEQFQEMEREFAADWGAQVKKFDLPAIAERIRSAGVGPKSCKTLEDAYRQAVTIVRNRQSPIQLFSAGISSLLDEADLKVQAHKKWLQAGSPPISDHAPYVAHVFTVELFFQIAMAAHLISSDRASNRMDVAYLFYLPFCHLFVSGDKLHRKCAPLFMRPDQQFVWAEDLKADLSQIEKHFAAFPDHIKDQGLMRFANRPPDLSGSLTCRLWNSVLGPESMIPPPAVDEIPDPSKITSAIGSPSKWEPDDNLDKAAIRNGELELDMVSLTRRVKPRRGSWKIFSVDPSTPNKPAAG